jgi:protein-tyrosine kinase
VVLIDADLRKPKVHKYFDLFRKPGLTEALMHHQQLNPLDEVLAQRTGEEMPQVSPLAMCNRIREVPNLYVMTAGEKIPNPAELLNSKRMAEFVEQLHQEVDVVVFDTPPLLAVTDAQIVGRMVDGTILVIDTEKTTGGAVYRALETLAQVNVPIMGAVLNRVSGSARGYYYYTYDYYGSESDEGDSGRSRSGGQEAGEYLRPRSSSSSVDPQAAG